jgi:hypothetical protein
VFETLGPITKEARWQNPRKSYDHPSRTHGLNACDDRGAIKAPDEKGVITDEELKQKFGEQRATNQVILKTIEQ